MLLADDPPDRADAMRWAYLEPLTHGLFLGLAGYLAVALAGPAAAGHPEWNGTLSLAAALPAVGLLAAALLAFLRRSAGLRVGLGGVLIYRLLDHPALVALGVAGGAAGGAGLAGATLADPLGPLPWLGVGLGLGVLMLVVRALPAGWPRAAGGLLLAAAVLGAAWYLSTRESLFGEWLVRRDVFAGVLAGAAALYALFALAGRNDVTEAEAGALAAVTGVAAYFWPLTPNMPYLSLLVPAAVYGVCVGLLPGLRVVRLVLRGLGQLYFGRLRAALTLLNQARRLAPRSGLVLKALRQLHLGVDLAAVERDPSVLELLDPAMCLDRAQSLLASPSGPEAIAEAERLLNLVLLRQPDLKAQADYLRCLADTHAKRYDAAAARLADLLDPARWAADDPWRSAVLLAAWQLALDRHPELTARLGPAHLDRPGRRVEAIRAVERHLADVPKDAEVWELKRMLMARLTEAEYEAALPADGRPVPEFPHDYALELGLALVNDAERWRRGMEFLRVAAHGMPARCGTVFVELGKAADDPKRGADRAAARRYYEQGKAVGLAVGPQNLPEEERGLFYGMLRWLADEAKARGDVGAALGHLEPCLAGKYDEVETLRGLAELYERKGDALTALLRTQEALCHQGKDADLLARQERYYSWLTPDEVAFAPESARRQLDADYCLKTAKRLLASTALENLDWAWGLVGVVRVLRPASVEAQVVAGKLLLRRGEREQALQILEDVRTGKPEKFASADEEDAWYECCRVLGSLYLDELDRPDLAVEAYNDFRQSRYSGADTLYHLGRAYERVGNVPAAINAYRGVTAYEQHPLTPDARSAVYRLQAGVR